MAVAFVNEQGSASTKTAGAANIAVATGSVAPVIGNVLVAFIAFDNAATASKPIVSSIGVPAGETNTWVLLGAARSTSTSAGAFMSGEIWAIQTSVAWPASTSFTVTLDSSVTWKATLCREYSGVSVTLRNTIGQAVSATTTAASATTTGTTPQIGDLAIGMFFQPNSTVGGAGDRLHPNRAGYQAMGQAVDLGVLEPLFARR